MMTNDAIGLFYRKLYHLMKLNKLEMRTRYELKDIHLNVIGERILYVNGRHSLSITWYYGSNLDIDVFNSNNDSIGQFEVMYNIPSDTNTFNEYEGENLNDEDAIFINKIRITLNDVQRLYYTGANAPV